MYKWISVKDKLPKQDETVLCYHKYEPDSDGIVCQNTYIGGCGYEGYIFGCPKEQCWRSDGSKVTHWMPLPEPPETT